MSAEPTHPIGPGPPGKQPDQGARAEQVRAAAKRHESQHTRIIRSARAGGILSALMLPAFTIRPPSGYGIITTTGRRTGKPRRKCIRMIRRGDTVYAVQLRPPHLAITEPTVIAAWLWNIRADPRVTVRIRGGAVEGRARELTDPAEAAEARHVFCDSTVLFDLGECAIHLRGLPTRPKIKDLHEFWFETGTPISIDLAVPSIRQAGQE